MHTGTSLVLSLVAIVGITGCNAPVYCEEPQAPFVLSEETYSKFNEDAILMREACVKRPQAQLALLEADGETQSNEPAEADLGSPQDPGEPEGPELGDPTHGQEGSTNNEANESEPSPNVW